MDRNRTVCRVTTLTRGEGISETEINVEVFGLVDPPTKMSWNEPPSSGGVDAVRALYYDGFKQRDIPLTSEEVKELSDELWLASSEEEQSYDNDDDPFYDED